VPDSRSPCRCHFAVVAICSSRATERRKAAIAALFSYRADKDLLAAIRHIAVLHTSDKNMAVWAKEDNEDAKKEARIIRIALNHFEYVGVAIDQGIYDEKIFKHAMYTTLVKLYQRTKPFIDELRSRRKRDTAWQEFECLAVRWINKPLLKKTVTPVQSTNWRKRLFGD
jgi:hypothetical protein